MTTRLDVEKLSYRTDDERRAFVRSKGLHPEDHCCLDMAWFVSEPVEWESQGPNPVILWIREWNEYRIDISHRGNSSTPIAFCPWYGTKLPDSRRDEWHRTLVAMGYEDPCNDDLPEAFTSDKWWRRLG